MIQKPTKMFLNELQITFKIHHQLSVDNDAIVFWYTKCSLVGLFTLVKDESNIFILFFWHRIWPLKKQIQNVNFFILNK
jgi:hypothetical protein